MKRNSRKNENVKQVRNRGTSSKFRSSIIVSQLASPHYSLTQTEKMFLLYSERGDCSSVQKIINNYNNKSNEFNINCLDPLNRSALIIGIEKENIDLINLLLCAGIKVKDSLLHAINEEYVEGVEVLLEWEEKNHVPGQPYSWELVDKSSSGFTLDITPVILAAHKNNYEILKLLLDRGATLPVTHDVRCGCEECVSSRDLDSLRHSQSRINAYRALTSPSLISLSSKDPLLTSIELYKELKRLEQIEAEFRADYRVMREIVQTFATSLLDHVRTSNELEIMLNYDADDVDPWKPEERQTLARLKLAIKYKLKMFVAHPNVQQLLASIWYKGLPGFRRKNMFFQIYDVIKMALLFAVYSITYMLAPSTSLGSFLKKPFVKFVCHSASYGFFLGLLALASQKVEYLFYELIGHENSIEWSTKERGSMPGIIESMIIIYILSLIWKELTSLYFNGFLEYLDDLWNILDFISNIFYITWISLRFTAIYIVSREYEQGYNPWYPRDQWDKFDPHMLSECAFASAMILSFMKLINIFSINPHLGPLQISLGRMIIDIIKFFFIYTLVLFAFGCGLNQLLWYFAGLEEVKCYHNEDIPDFETSDKACTIWRRFANLFETSQSLFWASFGLVDLTAFDLTGIKSFTRFWGLLIFGCYSAINIIVLLNMLIAMMSNSYQIISERADVEWKFARSKLFISFFEDEDTLPPPFNLLPTRKIMDKILRENKKKSSISKRKREIDREKADLRYNIVMQLLIRRYITVEQKKLEEFSVTEDDIAEVRHDISTLRFELMDIFKQNNFVVPKLKNQELVSAHGKKERIMERRIIKDFQIGVVEGIVNEIISTEKEAKNIFGKIAKAIARGDSNKKDWNTLRRTSTIVYDSIGSADEAQRRIRQMSFKRYIMDEKGVPLKNIDPKILIDYNPQLAQINPMARIAYVKFKMNLMKLKYESFKRISVDEVLIGEDNLKLGKSVDSDLESSAEKVHKSNSIVKSRSSSLEIINELSEKVLTKSEEKKLEKEDDSVEKSIEISSNFENLKENTVTQPEQKQKTRENTVLVTESTEKFIKQKPQKPRPGNWL